MATYQFPKRTMHDVPLDGTCVLVRADFNVPLADDGTISSDFRITQTIPTLRYLLERQAKVVVVAHLGRPDGKLDPQYSLQPVFKRLAVLLPEYAIQFIGSTIDDKARQAVKQLERGQLLLLENLRFYPGEEANDPDFAATLKWVSQADYFVQDGFGVVHRAHASTEAITHLLPAVAGQLLKTEVTHLESAMLHPNHPLVAVVGGAKISDKIGFIEKLLEIADTILIGGAMANTFLKYQGAEIGKSKYEASQEKEIATILQKAKVGQLILPIDIVTSKEIATNSQSSIKQVSEVEADDFILDLGPATMQQFAQVLSSSATVIWNGTLGMAEISAFAKASSTLAAEIGLNHPGITSVIGGGDTADFVLDWLEQHPKAQFSHISTGGGASLELMSGLKLPGVEALLNR